MSSSPSKFIIAEESDNSMFQPPDCDQDNYTQNVCRFMESDPKHKGAGVPMLCLDGHIGIEKFFDTTKMTYFTDAMAM